MENAKIIIENGPYRKVYTLNVDGKTFDQKYDEDFGEYVEEKLCQDFEKYGIYEYDGIINNVVYFDILVEEHVDLEKTYRSVEKIIEKYLKKKKLI